MIRTKIPELEAYLRQILQVTSLEVLQIPREDEKAEVSISNVTVGTIICDEDGDFQMDAWLKAASMDELALELKNRLLIAEPDLRQLHNKTDMAEVYIGDEFVGPIYLDEGGKGQFCIPILLEDLEAG